MTAQTADYRPDVDGLRAIAVLAVVLFHAGAPGFSGGYVGVDIFFVISGYLITRNIVAAIERDEFSLKEFYVRRFRRLFPALIATLLASAVVASALFQPEHLLRFGQELLAALFSVSNIYFWKVSGYFDIDAGYKALLHTWSLAIEEQFYLIWPALLGFTALTRFKHLAPVLIIVASLVSLVLAEYWVMHQQATAFYWLPARIFEFGFGAALVWLRGTKPGRDRAMIEITYLSGLAIVTWSISQYSYTTLFPGLNAALPCLGAALLIFSGRHAQSAALVNNRVMVSIGLISYSVYLVHWPLIVFYSYWKFTAVSNAEMFGIVVASILLGALLWRYVEQPFRRPANGPSLHSLHRGAISVALVVLVLLIGASMWTSQGWPWRFDSSKRYSADAIAAGMAARFTHSKKACRLDQLERAGRCRRHEPKQILFIGDSHEVDAINIWKYAFGDRPEQNLIMFGNVNQCDPLQEVQSVAKKNDRCATKVALLRDPEFVAQLDAVVYGASVPFSAVQLPRYLPLFKQMALQNPTLQFVFVGGYLKLRRDCSFTYNTFGELARCIDPEMLLHDWSTETDQRKAQAASFATLEPLIIDKFELLCSPSAPCKHGVDGVPFAWDAHHLSLPFAEYLGGLVADRYSDRLMAMGLLTAPDDQ